MTQGGEGARGGGIKMSHLTHKSTCITTLHFCMHVCSHVYIQDEINVVRRLCSVPPEHRDEDHVNALANVLNFIMFFKQLPQQAVFDLCRDIQYRAVRSAPIELFRQGTLGASVFLILSGKCSVYRGAKPTFDEGWKPFRNAYTSSDDIDRFYGKKQVTLESPANFGELAVMKKDKQATTVIAEVDTEMLIIEKKSYDNVVMKLNSVVCMPDQCRNILDIPPEKRTSVQASLLLDMLRRHRFFQQLPAKKPHVFRELCRHLRLLRIPENKVVCFQGQPGHQFLIILAGELALYQFDETVHETICKTVQEQQELLRAANPALIVNEDCEFDPHAQDNDTIDGAADGGGDDACTSTTIKDAMEVAEQGIFGSAINTLNAGDSFGERALMRNDNREFTAITKAPTEIMVIEKKIFDSMVAACGKTMFAADAMVAMLKVPPSGRDDATVDTLCQLTKDNKFLAGLPSSIHRELCKAMTYTKYNKDSVVFSQGDVGDSFYIIITGTLSVHVKSHDSIADRRDAATSIKRDRRRSSLNSFASVAMAAMADAGLEATARRRTASMTDPTAIFGPSVALVRSGDSFGELSLIQGAPRAATCITREVCEFLVISKSAYDEVLADLHARELTEKISALRHIPPLQDWSETKLLKISYTFVKRTYHRGRMIVQEGDNPSNLYIIISGECRVLKRSKQPTKRVGGARRVLTEKTKSRFLASTPVRTRYAAMPPSNFEIAVMGPGDFFGEYAAMQQCKQPITILASSTTVDVFTIAMSEFTKCLAEEHVVALREFSTEKMSWLVNRASHVSENFADVKRGGLGGGPPNLTEVLMKHGAHPITHVGDYDITGNSSNSIKGTFSSTNVANAANSKHNNNNNHANNANTTRGARWTTGMNGARGGRSVSPPPRPFGTSASSLLGGSSSSKLTMRTMDRRRGATGHGSTSPTPSTSQGRRRRAESPPPRCRTADPTNAATASLSSSTSCLSTMLLTDYFSIPSSPAQYRMLASSSSSLRPFGSRSHRSLPLATASGLFLQDEEIRSSHEFASPTSSSSTLQHLTFNESLASSLALTSRVWKKKAGSSVMNTKSKSVSETHTLLPGVGVIGGMNTRVRRTRPIKGFTTHYGRPMLADERFMHVRDALSHTVKTETVSVT